MTYTGEAWIDTVADRIEAALVAGTTLAPDRVFLSFADPKDHVTHPPADRFISIAPAQMPVDAKLVAGAGAAHTGFDAVWNVDVFARLGTDAELRSGRLIRDQSRGLGKLVLDAAKAVQLNPLVDGSAVSPLREPARVVSVVWNGARVGPGWAWARINLSVKMRTDLS